jgi:hypothetical protein
MGDSMKALMRSGAISGKQAAKHDLPKVLRMTKVERDKEEEFHGRQGLRDQGMGKERGHRISSRDHLRGPDQEVESKRVNGISERMSKWDNDRGHPGRNEIDEREHQRPEFPKSDGGKKASRGGRGYDDGDEGPDEIDQRSNQRPDFPRGEGREESTMASRGGRVDTGGYGGDRMPNKSGSLKIDRRDKPPKDWSNKRSRTKIAKSGPIYGGGSRYEQ